jgi:hypothetical protein
VQITEALSGRTIEDVRRNSDGSVSLYCDSGQVVTLRVDEGEIRAAPKSIILPGISTPETGTRMNLLESLQGFRIEYAFYQGDNLFFSCEPVKHNATLWVKSLGSRYIRLTHTDGVIDEAPSVSAVIKLPGLYSASSFGV